jgi:hypothetical protein
MTAAAEWELSLAVREPAGVARRAERISGGIPLPARTFRDGQAFALFEGHNELRRPVQVSPLVVDNDGFLRWILLDFECNLKPDGVYQGRLRPVRTSMFGGKLRLIETANGIEIDTCRLRFTIRRDKPFGLFGSVKTRGRETVTGGQVSYVDGFNGKRYVADKPSSIEVEYCGPARVTVCVRGRFLGDDQNKFQYVARITTWVNETRVHVKYSIANSNPDHYCYRTLKESSIELELSAEVTGTVLGASKPIAAGRDAALEQHLRTRIPGNAQAVDGERVAWTSAGSKDVADGWIAAKTPQGNVSVCDLYFADDPARRLALKNGSLILSGVIERRRAKRDARGREPGSPYHNTKRVLYDCSHLSSQYVIDFEAPDDPDKLVTAAVIARRPARVMASPAWYLHDDHFAFGAFGSQADEMRCYETWGWKYDPTRAPKDARKRYGRYFAGIDSHYEPEEDVVDQLLIMYLRTGSRPYFDYAQAWANYGMDLYAWRTDGWRWKDGGVWWDSGPKGNRPQRAKDPVTGRRERIPSAGGRSAKPPMTPDMAHDQFVVADSKCCYCHNWAAGLFHWYLLTGDPDALEAGVDRVEQDYDRCSRAHKMTPGEADYFRRGFTRSSYNAHVARMVLPRDPWIRKASDYFFEAFRQRPHREPRGFVNAGRRPRHLRPPRKRGGVKDWDRAKAERELLEKYVRRHAGEQGLAEMRRLGITFDFESGKLHDPKTGRKWFVVETPHTWMFPPLSRAMERYHRLTGNEDAMDWVIAFGQASAHLLYQEHTILHYGRMLVDFPVRGVAKDYLSWVKTDQYGTGVRSSGFLARFQPDVCARAYSLCGEPFLKRRAYEFWRGGSHRPYRAEKPKPFDQVGQWVNYYSDHDGQVDFILRTFYVHAHPRRDAAPPKPVGDLTVRVNGDKATVTFTAPADEGGGKVTRYQLKCSNKPIVGYREFLRIYNRFEDGRHTNWWMAANLDGEPAPGEPGRRERFAVSGVPEGAGYFALRSFDDSSNRSAISNIARVD